MSPIVVLAGIGAVGFLLSKFKGGGSAPLKVPPKPGPLPHPGPGPGPTPPEPGPQPGPHINPNPIPPNVLPQILPPNTVTPSPLDPNGPGTILVNPTTPSGKPAVGVVTTKSTGASGRLWVHSAMDTTTGSRVGQVEHGETVKLLTTYIADPKSQDPTVGGWYHIARLDDSLDGFASADFITVDHEQQ